ncbi:MAG: FKBP-type peptidyl-prolyl cis-trans isomerase [Bacillota bacterium]
MKRLALAVFAALSLLLAAEVQGGTSAAEGRTPGAAGTTSAANTPSPAAATHAAAPPPVMPMKPADATVLKDGLAYKVLKPGTGTVHPKLSDSITANYSLWKVDGTFLESTCQDGKCEPATFPLNKLIPGWQEMIPMMTVGEKLRVWLTSDLSYGDPPRKPNRPAGPLVFEIELVDIGRPQPPAKP